MERTKALRQWLGAGLVWCGLGHKGKIKDYPGQKMPSRACLIVLGIFPSF